MQGAKSPLRFGTASMPKLLQSFSAMYVYESATRATDGAGAIRAQRSLAEMGQRDRTDALLYCLHLSNYER